MGVSSFDEQATDVVIRLARSEHLAVVVGAGASVAAQLPGWEDLIIKLLSKRSGKRSRDVARLLAESQGYLLAAEAALPMRLSPGKRKEKVAKALFGNHPRDGFIPSELHQSVAILSSERGKLGLEIFTTNYDDLLEQALRDQGLACRPRHSPKNAGPKDQIPVHHIHGYLGAKSESEDVVIAQSDYSRITLNQEDWAGDEIASAASRGPVVFVGASMTDPNLLRMLDRLRDRNYERSVLVVARQGLHVPFELRDDFVEQLASQWTRYNVDVVMLEDFCDVSLFVREIATAGGTSYLNPRRRVEALWKRISERFDDFQIEFSTALDDGFARHLRSVLGSEANLVLWLSDAQGTLVRFSASDRIFRSPAALRRIPDRHDAGWVVSEAVAFETTAVRDLSSSSGPEGEVPDRRWKVIAATPLRPKFGSQRPVIAGALSAATVVTDIASTAVIEPLNELAAEWETRLEKLA